MRIDELDYHLPEGLIAQYPIEPRDTARLLVLKRGEGERIHTTFSRVGDFLRKDDVLVVNDTRVLPARLFGHKETEGKVEVLLLRKIPGAGEEWECLVNRGKRLHAGTKIRFGPDLTGEVVGLVLADGGARARPPMACYRGSRLATGHFAARGRGWSSARGRRHLRKSARGTDARPGCGSGHRLRRPRAPAFAR